MTNKIQYQLKLPAHKSHLLLHSCCAPCSGEIIQRLVDSKIKFSYRSGIDEYDKINSRFKCYNVRFTPDPDYLPYYRIRFYAGKRNNRETWSFGWDPNQIINESIDLFIQIYEQSLKELIYSG